MKYSWLHVAYVAYQKVLPQHLYHIMHKAEYDNPFLNKGQLRITEYRASICERFREEVARAGIAFTAQQSEWQRPF